MSSNIAQSNVDLLVVGGGILGVFYAYHALQAGLRVVLVERCRAPQGASVRNFGMVVPSGLNREWQSHGRESLNVLKTIHEQFELPIRELGSIYIASDEEELGLIEELHARNQAVDYHSELRTADQCIESYPLLRHEYCRGGLYFPQEISVEPSKLNSRLHEHLNEQPNYQCHFQTSIVAIESRVDGSIEAHTNSGQKLEASRAIICCGAELQSLYPEQLQSADIELVKLQMLRLVPQPGVAMPGNILTGRTIRRYESFSECPSWDSIKAKEAKNSFEDQYGIHILLKQQPDGAIVLGDSHEYVPADSAEDFSFELRGDINECFIAGGQQIFDLPSWQIAASWFGVYSQTSRSEGIFRSEVEPNIHITTAIGGKGMTSSAGFTKHDLMRILE